jgi:protein SCO1
MAGELNRVFDALGAKAQPDGTYRGRDSECSRPLQGPNADYIPNVLVQIHDQRKALFYQDLLLGKTTLIGCISGASAEGCRLLQTFGEVQAMLGDQLGNNAFVYCITTNPEHDTPDVLRDLADRHGARDGWLFLTGDPPSLRVLRERLFSHSGGKDCSMTLVRYGNEAMGLWGGLSSAASAEAMVERLSWVRSRTVQPQISRRKGPPPLAGVETEQG